MDIEGTPETGAESVEGSSAPETASPAPSPAEGSVQEAPAPAQKEPPFHEHPRFKELIEQNRAYKSDLANQAQSMSQLQAQLQQLMQAQQAAAKPKQDPNAPILERLKGIDPEFAQFQAQLIEKTALVEKLQSQLEELSGWKQQRDMESLQASVDKKLSDLYTQNKVSDELKPVYEAMIQKLGDQKPLSELPNVFKQVHESLGKMLSDRERKVRESYVDSKKKDQTPAPTTGGTAASANKPAKPMSVEDKIAFVAQEMRRAREKV